MRKHALFWSFSVIIILLVLCVALYVSLAKQQRLEVKHVTGDEVENTMASQWREDMERITSVWENGTHDLGEMERVAAKMEEKWRRANADYYCRTMQRLSGELASRPWSDLKTAVALSQKYALLGLERADAAPLEVEIGLLGYLFSDITEGCPPDRKKRAAYWLKAWQRLQSETDRGFDLRDLPTLNLPPPEGVDKGMSGMDPKDVKDPKLRAEYEKAIAKNKEKAEKYRRQHELTLLGFFPGKAEEYIVSVYSKPPHNMKELKDLLEEYVADEAVRARIWKAVEQNVAGQSTPQQE